MSPRLLAAGACGGGRSESADRPHAGEDGGSGSEVQVQMLAGQQLIAAGEAAEEP